MFFRNDAHSVLLLLEMMLCRTFVISKDVVDPASFNNFFRLQCVSPTVYLRSAL